jgi:hypothetical protein
MPDYHPDTIAAILPLEPAEYDPKAYGPKWADRGVTVKAADSQHTLDIAIADQMPDTLIIRCHQTGEVWSADLRHVGLAVIEALQGKTVDVEA